MPLRTHVFVAVVIVMMVLFVYWLVSKRVLKSKYALLWSAAAVILLPFAAFPAILDPISAFLGIDYEPTTILFAFAVLLFCTTVHLSFELSRNERQLRTLAEDVALLRARLQRSGALQPENPTNDDPVNDASTNDDIHAEPDTSINTHPG